MKTPKLCTRPQASASDVGHARCFMKAVGVIGLHQVAHMNTGHTKLQLEPSDEVLAAADMAKDDLTMIPLTAGQEIIDDTDIPDHQFVMTVHMDATHAYHFKLQRPDERSQDYGISHAFHVKQVPLRTHPQQRSAFYAQRASTSTRRARRHVWTVQATRYQIGVGHASVEQASRATGT